MSGANLIRIGLVVLALSFSSTADAKSKHGKGATRIRVHVMTAGGKPAGHARVTIRRAGHGKKIVKTAGRHGNVTTGSVAAGNYSAVARLRGHGAGRGSAEVSGAGTHKMTIKLGKARAGAELIAVHTRTAHSLGIKTTAKANAMAEKKRDLHEKQGRERVKAAPVKPTLQSQ
jgi:hypothetical protein